MIGKAGVLLAVVFAALVAAAPASAAPQINGEFSVSGLGTNNLITQGPDGNIWVTIEDTTNDVAKITPSGQVTEYALPDGGSDVSNPFGITSQGGNLWITWLDHVTKFAPGNPLGTAASTTIAALDSPAGIAVGPDGNLWTVSDNTVFKIPPGDPGTNTALPSLIIAGKQITAGGDGTMWATGATQVRHFTTAGAELPDSPHTFSGNTQGITRGPGTQIAFGCPQCSPQSVGRITPPGGGQLTPVGGNFDPGFGITFANDGAYWFTEFNQNRLARMTTQGAISRPLPKFSTAGMRGARHITKGPNNTLWVTLEEPGSSTRDKVARVTGVTTPTPPPPPDNCTEFTLGDAEKNKKKGTAELSVTVPCPGELALEGKKVKPVTETVAATAAGLQDAIEATLKVKAKGKAKKKLKKKGKAKVKMDVTYTPTGGEPSTQDTALTLKKK